MNWNWIAAFTLWLGCCCVLVMAWHNFITGGHDDEE